MFGYFREENVSTCTALGEVHPAGDAPLPDELGGVDGAGAPAPPPAAVAHGQGRDSQ